MKVATTTPPPALTRPKEVAAVPETLCTKFPAAQVSRTRPAVGRPGMPQDALHIVSEEDLERLDRERRDRFDRATRALDDLDKIHDQLRRRGGPAGA